MLVFGFIYTNCPCSICAMFILNCKMTINNTSEECSCWWFLGVNHFLSFSILFQFLFWLHYLIFDVINSIALKTSKSNFMITQLNLPKAWKASNKRLTIHHQTLEKIFLGINERMNARFPQYLFLFFFLLNKIKPAIKRFQP